MTGEKLKILYVEDKATSYLRVSKFLEKEGYKTLAMPGKIMLDNYDDAIAVCENEIPHMALLDIDLGKAQNDKKAKEYKDGLDIAEYIRENYYSPVIILSSYNTQENIRRAALVGTDGFLVKLEKPYDMKQLATTIQMLIPKAMLAAKKREASAFLFVKEFAAKTIDSDIYIKKRIAWSDLKFVKPAPPLVSPNCVLLEMINGKKYIYRTTLTDFQKELPPYFFRFTKSDIINANYFDGRGRGPWVFYINEERFEVSENLRTDAMLAALNQYVS